MKPTEISKAEKIVNDYNSLIQLFSDICTITGYSEEDIKSSSRNRCLVDTRAAFAYIANERFKTLMDKHIGEVINKDRTTVIAAIRQVKNVREKMLVTNFIKDELSKM